MTASAIQPTQALIQSFLHLYPDEAAKVLESLPPAEIVGHLRDLPPSRAVGVLDRLTPESAAHVIAALDEAMAREFLPAMDPARAALLLARLDEEERKRLLSWLNAAIAKELAELMTYPADTAGSLMDARVTNFRPDTRAEQALFKLRELPERRVQDVFLVDPEGRLAGTVALQDLAISSPTSRLEELARGEPVSVQAIATREEVVEELGKRRLTSLPVVDFEGRLIGVIRHEALMRALEQEASVDIQTMVGASKEERALSKVSFAVKKRLPWLQINLVTAFLAAAVVGIFEDTIARFTALAVLLPVVAGQSGNTGAQALAVTMRGLAVREIRVRHWWRVMVKEFGAASINGVAVALTTSLGVYVWSQSAGLAWVIGSSMVLSMIAAGIAGAAIPMILSALGQDPAQSSSIILTTVTDVVGFFSFLGIATVMAAAL